MKLRRLAFFFICLFIVQAGWAQQPISGDYNDSQVMPDGTVGTRIQAVIDTFNTGDPERIRLMVTSQCVGMFRDEIPMTMHIDAFQGLYRETGGLDFYGIRTFAPDRKGETWVIARDRIFQGWWSIMFRFDDTPDHFITLLSIRATLPPKGFEDPSLTEEDFLRQIKEITARLADKEVFSGTLLIAKGDKVLLTIAAGEASKAFHVLNNIDTKFNLGSMNKMFTSTAIMQLVEKGKLSLDDPIGKYIDESWLPKDVTAKIKIRHLLTHSSGLGSYFNDAYDNSSRALFRKLDDYKPLIKDDRPSFEPGSQFQYSNTGMFLLGVIIEKITGEDYFDYIRKAIYEPAGMSNTDCYEMDYPVENLAIGYSRDPKSPYGWQNNLYKHVIKGGPAGGGFSTVKDLHKFALTLLAGKYVSTESLKDMWTDHLKANYGYGFTISNGVAGKIVGHSGGFEGINSNLDIYLDSGYIIAVMSNFDQGANPIVRKTRQLIARIK
jgi:CubicO group peptidase (beta-lactamase class C family)